MSEHAIEVERLRRTFGSFVAVDDVSFHVEKGEIFGWLGANGAGKSTTIRMLIGVLPPSGGDALVAGHRLSAGALPVKRNIGYMSQRFSLYPDLTVRQNLHFFGGAYGLSRERVEERMAELAGQVELSDRLDALTADLPGGTRQRVALAASLLHEPRIVFLDEPTAGVDPVSRRRFWDLIRTIARQGTTVFVTTHHLDEAENCDRIGLMVDGKLVALDSPAGLARTWVPGTMYRLDGNWVHRVEELLRGKPGVIEVEPFGAGLHVRVDDVPPETVRGWVREQVPDVTVEVTQATLEDVFLAVVGAKVAP